MRPALALLLSSAPTVLGPGAAPGAVPLAVGKPEIRSMSALAFGPDGVLFVGDGKGGAVFALDLADKTPREVKEPKAIEDVEGKLAALLGATAADVLVHDLAVNPLSKHVYLAASRGRAGLASEWLLPNDVADASVLVRIDALGHFSVVDLKAVPHARVELPNPVDPGKKHEWKDGLSLRTETITDLSWSEGSLIVAGLSNEEFAATLWRVKYPFEGRVLATTVENFHGAHGKYETQAPVRTFVQYPLKGKSHLLAAYLCTPLVTFPLDALEDRRHVRGRTVGEFGAGNYPLDMVVFKKNGREKVLIANSNLPLLIVDPKDIEAFEGEIATEVPGYTAGVRYEPRSGTGIQQLDNLGEQHVVVLKRLMGGRLDLTPLPVRWF